MRNLLSAGFYRLVRYRLFWITLIGYMLLCVLKVIDDYQIATDLNNIFTVDATLFDELPVFGFFLAVLTSIFIGDEFRGGPIRNKIIAGYSRNIIYCCNFIIMAAAAIVELLAGYLVSFILGLVLGDGYSTNGEQIVILIMISIVVVVVYSALFTAIALVIGKRTATVVTCLIITGLMLYSAIMIISRLEAPKKISDYALTVDGEIVQEEPYDNPLYVEGTERQVLTVIHKLLPTGQAIRIAQREASFNMLWYSLIVIVFVTSGGMAIFYRKDNQ